MSDYVRALRKMIGTNRIFMPAVRAIIRNEAGDLLLQRRTDIPVWGLPAGGVEIGESLTDAVKREVLEETALTVLAVEPMGIYSGLAQQFTYPNGDQVQGLAMAFIITEWEGDPTPDGHEGTEVRFFPLDGIPEDLFPLHRLTIGDIALYDGTFIVS